MYGKKIYRKKKKYFILIFILFSINLTLGFSIIPIESQQTYEQKGLRLSSQKTHQDVQWLNNPSFEDIPIQPTWFSSSAGDLTDVNSSTSTGYVNFEVLGDTGVFSNISGIPMSSDWTEFNNSYFILPDGIHEINEDGLEASHTFDESFDQSRNRPSVHWRRNISLFVNMSDNIITSASLTALVNGSADNNLETPNDIFGGFATYYDHAIFYVEISNLDYENRYRVASYKTTDLGEGSSGTSYLNDTLMSVIDESNLIFYLSKALEKDPKKFGITLGIDIYCEDNYPINDLDNFYSLLIKSVNLSFTFEKKMNQLTSIGWNQVGDIINGSINNSTIEITKANLSFNYKISEPWPDFESPNSEIKILINNIPHIETIKLGLASNIFQPAKITGFDVTDLILPYENINISIQAIIGDEFGLNRLIIISIDDVFLEVSYIETFSDPLAVSEPLIFRILLIIASIAALCLGGYLVLYQKVLKYPRSVRKVRKFKRTLRRKSNPSSEITNRKKAFSLSYKSEINRLSKHLRGKPTIDLKKNKRGMKSTFPRKREESSTKGGRL